MKRIIFFLLALPVLVNAQDGIKPIIDVHLHGFTETSYRQFPGGPSYEDYKAGVGEQFRKFNIVAAVKSGGVYDADLEEKMLPGYQSNNFPKFDTLEFKKRIKEGKIKVWGEFMPMFNGLTIADPGFAPYLKICERENIPIALHTGRGPPNIYKQYPKYRLSLGDPILIEEVLIKYPSLKIYLMHSGIPFHENTLAIMDQYPQVYTGLGAGLWVDTGVTPQHVEAFLKMAKKAGFIDRIMYGSDAMVPSHIEKSIKKLDGFEFLDETDKRKIFFENAVTFFELEQFQNK